MEEKQKDQLETTQPQEQQVPPAPAYEPRPQWQVWAARIGLVIFLIILVIYYGVMFSGGGR